jgi:LysM domain
MKRMLFTMVLFLAVVAGPCAAFAQGEEPMVYVIKKGDTLWGLSDRFLKDPYYWPNLWARNPPITNPHLIFPGQKVKIYPDRIEVVPAVPPPPPAAPIVEAPAAKPAEPAAPAPATAPVEEIAPQKTFTVLGGAGFLLENGIQPAGHIVATYQNRVIVGEDDIVYTDIGMKQGGKVGDRYSIFKDMGPISHPVTNFIMGRKIIPLGTLQLSELEEKTSKAIVTKSFLEIGAGSYLMPYRDRKREVALKASDKDLAGYIIATQTGNQTLASGDIAFIDLGASQGVEAGNMLYIVRDVVPDQQKFPGNVDKLPAEVLGALVVVEVGQKTSTALIVKSIDTIYSGDRVELKKSK